MSTCTKGALEVSNGAKLCFAALMLLLTLLDATGMSATLAVFYISWSFDRTFLSVRLIVLANGKI